MNNPRTFVIRCSQAIFSTEEISILRQDGSKMEMLANGERQPKTSAQRRFVETAHGRRDPMTDYEKTWSKYMWRVKWESKPENRATMGERRHMPNDREDWKRMRGAVWGDMKRRSRGIDN